LDFRGDYGTHSPGTTNGRARTTDRGLLLHQLAHHSVAAAFSRRICARRGHERCGVDALKHLAAATHGKHLHMAEDDASHSKCGKMPPFRTVKFLDVFRNCSLVLDLLFTSQKLGSTR
jgi:hypothetical protein